MREALQKTGRDIGGELFQDNEATTRCLEHFLDRRSATTRQRSMTFRVPTDEVFPGWRSIGDTEGYSGVKTVACTVYFDTTMFIANFSGKQARDEIRLLVKELKAEKIRIYTSILTIQELSVATPIVRVLSTPRHYARINKLLAIQRPAPRKSLLTAAKIEAPKIA